MDGEVNHLIRKEVTFIRFTKGGLAYVCFEGKMYSLPRRNLEDPNAPKRSSKPLEGWTVKAEIALPGQYNLDTSGLVAELSKSLK